MSIVDAFAPTIAAAERRATGDPDEIREHVLTLARAWERDELPLRSVAQQSTPVERYVAMGRSFRIVDDRRLLTRLSTALIEIEHELYGTDTRVFLTAHGPFTQGDVRVAAGRVRIETTRDDETGDIDTSGFRIDFPVRDNGTRATYGETTAQRNTMANEDARTRH